MLTSSPTWAQLEEAGSLPSRDRACLGRTEKQTCMKRGAPSHPTPVAARWGRFISMQVSSQAVPLATAPCFDRRLHRQSAFRGSFTNPVHSFKGRCFQGVETKARSSLFLTLGSQAASEPAALPGCSRTSRWLVLPSLWPPTSSCCKA